jgi:hypothetical protein
MRNTDEYKILNSYPGLFDEKLIDNLFLLGVEIDMIDGLLTSRIEERAAAGLSVDDLMLLSIFWGRLFHMFRLAQKNLSKYELSPDEVGKRIKMLEDRGLNLKLSSLLSDLNSDNCVENMAICMIKIKQCNIQIRQLTDVEFSQRNHRRNHKRNYRMDIVKETIISTE